MRRYRWFLLSQWGDIGAPSNNGNFDRRTNPVIRRLKLSFSSPWPLGRGGGLEVESVAKPWLPSSITNFRNELTRLEGESGGPSPLDCKDDKSLSTLWLGNIIKWTGEGSLHRKLAELRCEDPRSWTNKNQSFPPTGEMTRRGWGWG